eukprot:10194902-Lingulodinium_polyedra.AAC.1
MAEIINKYIGMGEFFVYLREKGAEVEAGSSWPCSLDKAAHRLQILSGLVFVENILELVPEL